MLDKNKISRLAFCVFAKQLHVAWSGGDVILPIENNRVETVLFDVLTTLHLSSINEIIIPAGPAPFTQLRILRSTQLGLATGLGCVAPMVNIFDVLFANVGIDTGTCLLETRRGDYFLQTRIEGKITDEGVFPDVTDSCAQQLESVRAGTQKKSVFFLDPDSNNPYMLRIRGCNDREDRTEPYTIISDDPKLSTIEITRNLAKTMLENDLRVCEELIYGVKLPY